MEDSEFNAAPCPRRPRTITVLGLLTVAAAVLSYLGSYAMTNALVAADVLHPWPVDRDPRPQWFCITFVVLISAFVTIGSVGRMAITRHMRQFEKMERAEDAECDR
jgi:hypothetical protein